MDLVKRIAELEKRIAALEVKVQEQQKLIRCTPDRKLHDCTEQTHDELVKKGIILPYEQL